MKTALLFFAFYYPFCLAAQSFTLPELLSLASSSTDRFVNSIAKKGFLPTQQQEAGVVKMFHPKDSVGERYLVKKEQRQSGYLLLEKLSPAEYETMKQKALADGFIQGKGPGKTATELFQKKDVTITVSTEIDLEAEKRWYNVTIEKRNLPKAKDVAFAEDLLHFNAHEHLVSVFGKSHVVSDTYFDKNGAQIPCSVLYPNTGREAVFVWKDGTNLRDLACLRIGSNNQTSGALRNAQSVAQSQWISRQGVFPTMSLNQLQQRNQQAIAFSGWGGGHRGELKKGNTGRIDFEQLDLSLSCLNCNDDVYYGNSTIDSEAAILDGRRIFVATMIFYPNAGTPE